MEKQRRKMDVPGNGGIVGEDESPGMARISV